MTTTVSTIESNNVAGPRRISFHGVRCSECQNDWHVTQVVADGKAVWLCDMCSQHDWLGDE